MRGQTGSREGLPLAASTTAWEFHGGVIGLGGDDGNDEVRQVCREALEVSESSALTGALLVKTKNKFVVAMAALHQSVTA